MPSVKKSENGKRIYDRTHPCYICVKLDAKIGRHLLTRHKLNPKVISILKLDTVTQAKQRNAMLDHLRYIGDFYHNIKILESGGELIVFRRPQEGIVASYKDYMPCKYCLSFLHKQDLWRHTKKCMDKQNDVEDGGGNSNVQTQAEMLLYTCKQQNCASLDLHQLVISRMQEDNITDVVRRDNLITKYGEYLLSGKGSKKANYISQHMRLLGRLLSTLRIRYPKGGNTLTDYLDPINFDVIVECAKELGEYTAKSVDGEYIPSFKKPSLPLKLGYALHNILMIMKGIGLRQKDHTLIENAQNMIQLYESEWSGKVSSASLRTLGDNKFQKAEMLPITSDLMKLRRYCEERLQFLSGKKELNIVDWREMAELIITRLTIFNKRRGNEVSSLLLKSYLNRNTTNKNAVHDDVYTSLTPLERKLMER